MKRPTAPDRKLPNPSPYGDLINYATGVVIGPATKAQMLESERVARMDGGAGVIDVGGKACYVEEVIA